MSRLGEVDLEVEGQREVDVDIGQGEPFLPGGGGRVEDERNGDLPDGI